MATQHREGATEAGGYRPGARENATGNRTASLAQAGGNVVPLPEPDHGTIADGREWPLIPDGEYRALYVDHETAWAHRTPRLFVLLAIVDPPHVGAKVFRCYRLKSLKSPKRKKSGFTVGRRSDLVLEFSRVCGWTKRPDRLCPRDLAGRILRIKTGTVTTDYQQRELPAWMQYSVCREILGSETGT